jgi:hypothetical protein
MQWTASVETLQIYDIDSFQSLILALALLRKLIEEALEPDSTFLKSEDFICGHGWPVYHRHLTEKKQAPTLSIKKG